MGSSANDAHFLWRLLSKLCWRQKQLADCSSASYLFLYIETRNIVTCVIISYAMWNENLIESINQLILEN